MWNMFIRNLLRNRVQAGMEFGLLLLDCIVLNFIGRLLAAGISIYQSDWYDDVSGTLNGIMTGGDNPELMASHALMILGMLAVIMLLLLTGVCFSLWATVSMGARQERQANALLEAIGYKKQQIRRGTWVQQGLLAIAAVLPAWGIAEAAYSLLRKSQTIAQVLEYGQSSDAILRWIQLAVPFVLLLLIWLVIQRVDQKSRKDSVIKRLYRES